MQTSADFRSQNRILSTRKIVHESHGTGKDFIDTNGNGVADFQGHARSVMVTYDEPALSTTLDNVAAFGARRDTEVVTGAQLKGKLEGQWEARNHYDESTRCWEDGGTESLDKVATQCEPLEEGVQWAIDTHTHEFVLFKPGV